MANFAYNAAKNRALTGALNLESGTYRMLALTANSDVNADDDDLATALARAGTTEVDDGTVTSYARQALAYTGTTNQAGSVELDDTNDRAEWHFDDVTFDLATGGPVTTTSVIVYLDVAGDDSSDATAIPLFHWDAAGSNITELVIQNGAQGAVHAT